MKYIKDTLDFKIEEPSVITLGKFDGLHTGHRYLMDAMQKGKEQGLKCVIFTFDIPPKAIHKDAYSVLSTNEEKAHIFAEAGVDYLVECPFTDEFRQLSPYAFLQMLKEKINVKMIGLDLKADVIKKCNDIAKKYNYEKTSHSSVVSLCCHINCLM